MAAAKAFVAGGVGAQPSLDDVVRVALGCQIALDTAGAERVKKESPPPKSFQAEAADTADAPGCAATAALPVEQARAALACRLLSIMNGKSGVRLQVAEFLRDLLNHNLVPALPAEAAADVELLQALTDACKGLGSCSAAAQGAAAPQQPLSDALAAAELSAPGVSVAERVVLQGGASASAGIGSLVVVGGRRLLNGATAVAALSCEAFGAQVKAFDADAVEAQSYKAAISIADELRGLLEGSKLVNTRRDASPEAAQLFASLPQRLGAVQESLTSAYNAVRPEVQSGALPAKGSISPNAPSPLLASTLLDAARALLALATDSLARASAVALASLSSSSSGAGLQLQQLVTSPSSSARRQLELARAQLVAVGRHMLGDVCSVPGVAAGQAAVAALGAAHGAVALEALVAVAALRLKEGPPPPQQPDVAAAPSPTPEDNSTGKENASGGKKDKKKDKKGGGASAFTLGKGTAVARASLEAAAAVAAGFGPSSTLPLAPGGDAAAAAAAVPGTPAAGAGGHVLAEGAFSAAGAGGGDDDSDDDDDDDDNGDGDGNAGPCHKPAVAGASAAAFASAVSGLEAAVQGGSNYKPVGESTRRKSAATGSEPQDLRQLKAYMDNKPVLEYERNTIVTEARRHLPLPKKFVRQFWPSVVDGGAPQPVQLSIVDDGVELEGLVPGSMRPLSRNIVVSPGNDVLANHRGWRFCRVVFSPSGALQLHFDSSTAASYQPAVGRKWAWKESFLPDDEDEHTSRQAAYHRGKGANAAGALSAAGVGDGDADPALPTCYPPAALGGLEDALQPLGPALPKLLEDVRLVVEANQVSRKPKIPKGARDFLPDQMAIREAAFAAITGVFKRHGAVAIDTPVFELRETLMGKYGEDSKLIYDLADQGGELLSLRYDLTVPFARYVAVNQVGNIKRYHIGKVYRRDQPQMNRGRFREFFQCDFDIAGTYASMVPEAEVLKVVTEILTDLKLGKFTIKLNHRGILDAMLAIAGVPAQKFRPICSAIDKLDKEPWSEVRREMVEDKGLPPAVADKIGEFVVYRGEPLALLAQLKAADHPLMLHPQSKAALEDMHTLFGFLQSMGALTNICFDLSLARGLDYYTGVIYEAVLEGASVGSIAAGGRYDRLVGMFSSKDVPAVGVSIGIERVFVIMEAQARERAAASGVPIRATETEVLVASIGNNMQNKRMELAAKLWESGIKAEFGFKPNPKMGDQLTAALEQGIPFMVLFGDDELQNGVVKVKDMAAKEETAVPLDQLVPTLHSLIAAKQQPGAGAASSPQEPAPQQQPQAT